MLDWSFYIMMFTFRELLISLGCYMLLCVAFLTPEVVKIIYFATWSLPAGLFSSLLTLSWWLNEWKYLCTSEGLRRRCPKNQLTDTWRKHPCLRSCCGNFVSSVNVLPLNVPCNCCWFTEKRLHFVLGLALSGSGLPIGECNASVVTSQRMKLLCSHSGAFLNLWELAI